MAAKAESLRKSNARTAWKAAIASSVLTIALAFGASYVTGNTAQDEAIEHNAEEIKDIVNQARLTQCINARESLRLLVDLPGTPNIASIQDCTTLPRVEYDFYREGDKK